MDQSILVEIDVLPELVLARLRGLLLFFLRFLVRWFFLASAYSTQWSMHLLKAVRAVHAEVNGAPILLVGFDGFAHLRE